MGVFQPNVRRQATFSNRDTESVAALTPNIELGLSALRDYFTSTRRISVTSSSTGPVPIISPQRTLTQVFTLSPTCGSVWPFAICTINGPVPSLMSYQLPHPTSISRTVPATHTPFPHRRD